MDNTWDYLALSMENVTLLGSPTRSKKRKDKIRFKQVRLQQEQQHMQRESKLAQRRADLDQKPFPFLDLPYDIRLMIYKLLFVRPICISPAVNFYRHKPKKEAIKYSVYRYQWANQRQEIPQWHDGDLPSRDGTLRNIWIEWSSEPTEEQIGLAATGTTTLPSTGVQSDSHGKAMHSIRQDEDGTILLYNCQVYHLSGFFEVKLLRTCKQLRKEGTEILYGDNVFSFEAGVHRGDVLEEEENPKHIPGLPSPEGVDQSKEEASAAINRIFDKECHHPRFVWQDPLLHFFTRIGPYNVGLLKSIKISGEFKTWYQDAWYKLGLENILPIYTLVLRNTCKSLRKVYLDGEVDDANYWGHYKEKERDLVDHEALSRIVQKLAEGLPQLKHFHLGWSGDVHGKRELSWSAVQSAIEEEKWGHALKWVDIVNNREEVAPSITENQEIEGSNVDEGHINGRGSEAGEEEDTTVAIRYEDQTFEQRTLRKSETG
ncbi:hypothetical protein BDZ45DRAFT_684268 [Acephala macrosclerotiorum]|nr:hypothetical protein BDZ45DRAFT_684268 [Acephala macrosclerotiorum]